ncbi:MAG: hypothetical protein AAFP19_22360 [Bacteroidota bacterium]
MKPSSNDRRERNGRRIFIFGCAFFITLLGAYIFVGIQAYVDLAEGLARWADDHSNKRAEQHSDFFFDDLMSPGEEYRYYVEDTSGIFLLRIAPLDSFTLGYEWEKRLGGRMLIQRKGEMMVEKSSIKDSQWSIRYGNDYFRPAYRFLEDYTTTSQIEILVSKRGPLSTSVAVINELSGNQVNSLSPPLFFKK